MGRHDHNNANLALPVIPIDPAKGRKTRKLARTFGCGFIESGFSARIPSRPVHVSVNGRGSVLMSCACYGKTLIVWLNGCPLSPPGWNRLTRSPRAGEGRGGVHRRGFPVGGAHMRRRVWVGDHMAGAPPWGGCSARRAHGRGSAAALSDGRVSAEAPFRPVVARLSVAPPFAGVACRCTRPTFPAAIPFFMRPTLSGSFGCYDDWC